MQLFSTLRVPVAVLAGLFIVSETRSQVTFPAFSTNHYYTSNLPWQIIGWRSSSSFIVFQTELNGFGATEHTARYAVPAPGNTIAIHWDTGDNYSQVPLGTQSASWLASHPSSGVGSTKYTFPGPYFTSSGKIPTVANLATNRTFASGSNTYNLRLYNDYGPIEKDANGLNGYRRAKFTLKIRRASGSWHTLQADASFSRRMLMYGIDKIVVSPDGLRVAVFLVRYSAGWFEGWNVATERMVVTGSLP
jgi:hypothetical protein